MEGTTTSIRMKRITAMIPPGACPVASAQPRCCYWLQNQLPRQNRPHSARDQRAGSPRLPGSRLGRLVTDDVAGAEKFLQRALQLDLIATLGGYVGGERGATLVRHFSSAGPGSTEAQAALVWLPLVTR